MRALHKDYVVEVQVRLFLILNLRCLGRPHLQQTALGTLSGISAIIDRLKVHIIDTVGAYLYQTYPDTLPPIYIEMPVKVMQACNIPDDVVYRIQVVPSTKPYAKLLVYSGYVKSKSGPYLFLKFSSTSEDRIYIWVHVYATFVAATTTDLLDEFETVVITIQDHCEE